MPTVLTVDDSSSIRSIVGKALRERFAVDGRLPRSVLVIDVVEVYRHCSKALRRSQLWDPDRRVAPGTIPGWGAMLREQGKTILPAKLIDFAIEQDAKRRLY